MSESRRKDGPQQSARRHTAHLLGILRGHNISEAAPAYKTDVPLQERRHPTSGVPPPRHRTPAPETENLPLPTPVQQRAKLPKNSFLPIEEHLQRPDGRLARLISQTQHLAKLNNIFLAYLPPHLREHATLARLDQDAWVVQTDSSAWATRLRFSLPSIRQPLQEHLGIELPPPRIRIAPPAVAPPPPPPPRRMNITEKTLDTLENAARDLNDPRLGAALLRLAKHARQRQSSA